MSQKFGYLLLSIFLSFSVFSQEKKVTREDVLNLLITSDSLMFKTKYKQSLLLSNEALKKAKQLKNDNLIALSYNSIAGNYEEILEEDKALDFYKKAVVYSEKASNDTLKNWFYNNIGNIYLYRKNNVDVGIEYYNKSLEFSNRLKDTASTVLTKLNLSWAYFQKKDYTKAIQNLDFAEKHIDYMRFPDTETYLNLLLGMKFNHLKDNEKAKLYYEKAIAISTKNQLDSYLSDSYEQFANHLFEIGDYKNAYLALDKHEEVKDRVFRSENIKNAELVALKIELEESKKEIQKIKKERSLQSDNLKKTKIIVTLILVFLMLMMFLLYILYRNNIFRRKINNFLESKNEELNIAKEKAEEASKLKTQFISTISHELRTPLYGVVGITNMLSDEHKELANSPHLNSLKFSARYLLSLVNDLLQINKIEENKVVLEHVTMNVADEINMVSNSLSFIATRNNNKVITEIDPTIPEFLVGDKIRLSQILMNLVSNALKFTQNGEVKIKAGLDRKENSLCYIKFEVIDTGMGIAEKDLGKIFDKFVQIDRKEDDYQGAGLGLSIVKKLVKLFGSEIFVKSQEGKGTAFDFTIAFDSDSSKVNEIINNIPVDLSNAQIYKVLVVEDNKINQMVTRKIMEKSNFKTLIVDDGYAAIEALSKEPFDVVLMDINMPLINGFETTKLIRKKGLTIPIIALTAFAKDEISEEAFEAGMNDVLIKPFEPTKLIYSIEMLVKRKND
ncbi:response regulator [Flavobacterium piscinae]|uniref:histidine kinase n=1 Tax=Flavobacterium piscinae TaxID=2506424 RepID=A0A4Q1KRD7_9FLAO|nr:response regulator [Flavobacterium piscinae]RXR32638.1 response regulator [Flavobacterium piscinae]